MGVHHNHDHGHDHGPDEVDGTSGKLLIALQINLLFLFVEAAGGWFTNSLALLSDAGHMLSDVGALGLALGARWLATRPATTKRTFGYQRAEILAAFFNALLLFGIVIFIAWEAVDRFDQPENVESGWMTIIAFLGLLANAGSAYILHGSTHGDMNVRGAYLHLMADTLGSVGALGAGLFMIFGGSSIVDPVVSVVIAGLVCWGAVGLMRQSTHVLMEATPAHIDVNDVMQSLARLAGVREVHDLHVWQIGTGLISLTGHLVVHAETDRDLLLMQAQGILRQRHGIHHLTLQTETEELHRFLTTEEQTVTLGRKDTERSDRE